MKNNEKNTMQRLFKIKIYFLVNFNENFVVFFSLNLTFKFIVNF